VSVFICYLRISRVATLASVWFTAPPQVSDVAMHLKNQNIFVHSGHSNQLKVVQDDPGARSIHFMFLVMFSRGAFALNFLFDFAEVAVTFEWEQDKADGNPLAGAGGPSETVKSSQTKYVLSCVFECLFLLSAFDWQKSFVCSCLHRLNRLSPLARLTPFAVVSSHPTILL
jgi:hypothetical protein